MYMEKILREEKRSGKRRVLRRKVNSRNIVCDNDRFSAINLSALASFTETLQVLLVIVFPGLI